MRTPPSAAVVVRISPTLEASPGGGSVLRSIFERRLRLLRRGLDLFAERLVQARRGARHPADVAAPEADTRAAAACFVDIDPVVVRRERPADRPAGDDPAAAGTTSAVARIAPAAAKLQRRAAADAHHDEDLRVLGMVRD